MSTYTPPYQILVVDDDPFFTGLITDLLELDGHMVSCVTDGISAIKLLEHYQPDLIITDILMPNMNGVDLILALSRNDSHIPIIATSGGRRAISPDFSLESAKLLGVTTTISKPFTRKELQQAIRVAMIS